jgi:phage protein D/phage baseplate assembly protein gpV
MKPVSGVPRLTVRLGGRELTPAEADALTSIRVRQALSVPASCELSFSTPEASLLDAAVSGATLEVAVGEAGPLFAGDITAVESSWGGPRLRELRVRGYDPLHRLRKRQPVRAHAQVTTAGIARELAGDLGVEVVADRDSPVWPWLLQWKQSDLDFLAELAGRTGLYLVFAGGVIRLLTLEGAGEPVPLVAGEGLTECEVEVNADRTCQTVEATGFDLVGVQPHRARVEGLPPGRPTARALTSGRACALADVASPTESHLEATARAELLRRAATEVVLRGVAEGDPRLRPGVRVALSGVAAPLRGTYVLTSVDHVIDSRRGFLSSVSTASPDLPAPETGAGATLAEVAQVDATSGRVKVRLVAHGDVETDWLPIASAGAGVGKGLMALPDVGDHVLVLFHASDAARGVVLAGLWSSSGPPDAGVKDGRVRRWALRSSGGHQLELDDAKSALRLGDSSGSFVEMTPRGVKLHAEVPLTIEAPGQPIVVLGDAVDFRRG